MKSNEPRTEHIKRIQERYQGADKRKKAMILSEFCLSWNLDRKYAPKLLNGKRATMTGLCGI